MLSSAGVRHVALSTEGDWLRPLAAFLRRARRAPLSFEAPDPARLPARRSGGGRGLPSWLERHRAERAAAWAHAGAARRTWCPTLRGWRRHCRSACCSPASTLLLVGFARPKATITREAPRGDRRARARRLGLDGRERRAADRASAPRGGSASSRRPSAEDLPDRGDHLLRPRRGRRAADARPNAVLAAIKRAKAGPQGTALADAVARGGGGRALRPRRGRARVRRPWSSLFSDGGQTAARPTPQQAAPQARKAHVPVSAVAVGTANGVVQQKMQGGLHRAASRFPSSRRRSRRSRRRAAGGSTPHDVGVRPGRHLRRARLPGRQGAEARRGDGGRGGRRDRVHARRRAALGRLVPEDAVKRAASAVVALVAALRAAFPRAGRRRDERVPRHPGLHPRARAVGGRAARPDGPVPALVPERARASSPGSTRRRRRATFASSFDGAARRAGLAGRDDDAERALPARSRPRRARRRSSRCSAASRRGAAAAARRSRRARDAAAGRRSAALRRSS